MNIGVYFGSTTGNTENVAELISKMIDATVNIDYIENLNQENINKFDLLIFGVPTWNVGELESSWEDFLPSFEKLDFSSSFVAIYGLGDQVNYEDSFVDAMGILYDTLKEKQVKILGSWSTNDYIFNESLAVRDGKFVGLALDIENQDNLTEQRLEKWLIQLQDEYLTLNNQLITAN